MAMQTILNGGFVTEEITKVNANFSEIETDYALKEEIPTVPTKTSQLTNDSGFITSADIPAIPTKTSQLTNDSGFITSASTKVTFTTANWSSGTFTTPANGKVPMKVMRQNGSNYESVIIDVQVVGTNVVITSDEAFNGYVILV